MSTGSVPGGSEGEPVPCFGWGQQSLACRYSTSVSASVSAKVPQRTVLYFRKMTPVVMEIPILKTCEKFDVSSEWKKPHVTKLKN